VLVLGASYRESVKETYNSGALQINKLLDNSGHLVYVWDPLFSNEELGDLGLNPWTVDLIGKIDCVVIANRDDKLMPFLKDNLINCSLIIDGRNFLGRSFNFEGVPVVTLGLGTPRT
jgi:UDP-N-acetyl-D-mannosaminuronate dehydrogenase